MQTRLRTVLGGTVLGLSAVVALAAPASAESPTVSAPAAANTAGTKAQCADDFAYPGVNIRALPNTNGTIRGQGNPGDCLQYHKVTTGEYLYCPELGMWGDQWYDVTNKRTGVRGWIVGCYVT